jgi:acyl-coenzyme A synthetase/AMP-(fatty) acid ligase
VEFRDSLPKTMTGKVLRRALVAEHKKHGRSTKNTIHGAKARHGKTV